MKRYVMLFTAICLSIISETNAQAPAGFTSGSITLSSGSTVTGFIKESFKKNAAISFSDSAGNRKQYDGVQISGAVVDATNYQCIKGDFFKVLCTGKICFLQKASDASAKPSYNGAEAIFASGTDGKIGDYFVYSNNQLTHITKKTVNSFINQQLSANAAAMEKAKAINGDVSLLADAIALYNKSAQ